VPLNRFQKIPFNWQFVSSFLIAQGRKLTLGYRGPSHRLAMKVVLQNSTSGRGTFAPSCWVWFCSFLSSALSGTPEAQKICQPRRRRVSKNFLWARDCTHSPAQTETGDFHCLRLRTGQNELHNRLVEIYQQPGFSAKETLPSEHSTQVRRRGYSRTESSSLTPLI